MKKYKKGTVEYKLKAISVNCLGVVVIVNYWVSVISNSDVLREAIVWTVLELVFLKFCAWAEYEGIRGNPLFLEILIWIDSFACIKYSFSVPIVIGACLIELCIFVFVRYYIKKYYEDKTNCKK